MKLQILKCHGSGNDFILIDEYKNSLFTEAERIILAKVFCNRKGVLGADGILFFLPSNCANGKMRMFNPDGSEAELCGNGLRCVGRFACEKLGQKSVLIETQKGTSRVEKMKNMSTGVETYQAELNTISLNSQAIITDLELFIEQPLLELSENLQFSVVAMPNPHLVAIVDKIADPKLQKIGEKANQLITLFPQGINVNFVQILNQNAIFVRTYERGVGLTNSCGSGMSASALISCLCGYNSLGQSIEVYNQGGLVKCKPVVDDNQYTVFLTGNATFVFTIMLEFEFPDLKSTTNPLKVFVDEIQDYGKFIEISSPKDLF